MAMQALRHEPGEETGSKASGSFSFWWRVSFLRRSGRGKCFCLPRFSAHVANTLQRPAVKQCSTHELRIGPLFLRLKTSAEGILSQVLLPKTPPPDFLPEHLLAAFIQLRTWNLPAPSTESEANFRQALEKIPLGTCLSYGSLAVEINSSPRGTASRCAANPFLLRLPCHRVVGKEGLGGYQCGDIWKATLLSLERQLAPPPTGHLF